MQEHGFNIAKSVIRKRDYSFSKNIPANMELKEKIIVYYDGKNWNVIPLNIFYKYHVIYDKYEDSINGDIKISICVCPFTLSCVVFSGKYFPSKYVNNFCLILTDEGNNLLPIYTKNYLDPDGLLYSTKRYEIEIKLLRNLISEHPDAQYFTIINEELTKKDTIFDINYYSNMNLLFKFDNKNLDYHPKTLVYVIQYLSMENQKEKFTIIVGKNANKETPKGYNTIKSGFKRYLTEMDYRIKNKIGFIIPIFWFAVENIYKNAKIIKL
jgi:hypothetical protein